MTAPPRKLNVMAAEDLEWMDSVIAGAPIQMQQDERLGIWKPNNSPEEGDSER